MPSDRSRRKTPETLGSGAFDPRAFQLFSRDGPNVVSIYGDATDMSVVVWNLEPGQENSVHSHPTNAHAILVLEGSGVYLRGQGEPVPITAGQLVVVPRNVPHGIRNTGASRLSYLAVSSWESGGGYVRAEASKQAESPHQPSRGPLRTKNRRHKEVISKLKARGRPETRQVGTLARGLGDGSTRPSGCQESPG